MNKKQTKTKQNKNPKNKKQKQKQKQTKTKQENNNNNKNNNNKNIYLVKLIDGCHIIVLTDTTLNILWFVRHDVQQPTFQVKRPLLTLIKLDVTTDPIPYG